VKIYLPHINYTVHVFTLKKRHKILPNAKAYAQKGENGKSSAIYLPSKPTPGTVAHEVVHVLRYICEARDMSFLLEEEHMAYIAQHLTNEILGYEWYLRPLGAIRNEVGETNEVCVFTSSRAWNPGGCGARCIDADCFDIIGAGIRTSSPVAIDKWQRKCRVQKRHDVVRMLWSNSDRKYGADNSRAD
jgi:hypothetical protein